MSDVRGSHSLALIGRVEEAFESRNWQELRGLYHDQALLRIQSGHGEIVGPDGLIAALKPLDASSFDIGDVTYHAIDDSAVLASGRLRYRLESGGFADSARTWIVTFKDDLVWRTDYFHSEPDAVHAYEEHGIDLGIDATQSGATGSPHASRSVPRSPR
jgi:hypothetical protein